ncbi:MAG: ribosome maturation factor RimP [Acidobacteria bacterium]|nr:ribosome maturation factor RimP [Acidobacteriota bacterium]
MHDTSTASIEGKVRALATPALLDDGIELVGVEFRREPAGWVLRMFIDKPEGVGLDHCRRVSEVVGTMIEVEDAVPHAYTLEVSSPGLTRSLQSDSDFSRAIGRTVKVVTRRPVGGRQDIVGRLVEMRDDVLRIDVGGSTLEVGRELVARARLELDWPGTQKKAGAGAPRRRNPRK